MFKLTPTEIGLCNRLEFLSVHKNTLRLSTNAKAQAVEPLVPTPCNGTNISQKPLNESSALRDEHALTASVLTAKRSEKSRKKAHKSRKASKHMSSYEQLCKQSHGFSRSRKIRPIPLNKLLMSKVFNTVCETGVEVTSASTTEKAFNTGLNPSEGLTKTEVMQDIYALDDIIGDGGLFDSRHFLPRFGGAFFNLKVFLQTYLLALTQKTGRDETLSYERHSVQLHYTDTLIRLLDVENELPLNQRNFVRVEAIKELLATYDEVKQLETLQRIVVDGTVDSEIERLVAWNSCLNPHDDALRIVFDTETGFVSMQQGVAWWESFHNLHQDALAYTKGIVYDTSTHEMQKMNFPDARDIVNLFGRQGHGLRVCQSATGHIVASLVRVGDLTFDTDRSEKSFDPDNPPDSEKSFDPDNPPDSEKSFDPDDDLSGSERSFDAAELPDLGTPDSSDSVHLHPQDDDEEHASPWMRNYVTADYAQMWPALISRQGDILNGMHEDTCMLAAIAWKSMCLYMKTPSRYDAWLKTALHIRQQMTFMTTPMASNTESKIAEAQSELQSVGLKEFSDGYHALAFMWLKEQNPRIMQQLCAAKGKTQLKLLAATFASMENYLEPGKCMAEIWFVMQKFQVHPKEYLDMLKIPETVESFDREDCVYTALAMHCLVERWNSETVESFDREDCVYTAPAMHCLVKRWNSGKQRSRATAEIIGIIWEIVQENSPHLQGPEQIYVFAIRLIRVAVERIQTKLAKQGIDKKAKKTKLAKQGIDKKAKKAAYTEETIERVSSVCKWIDERALHDEEGIRKARQLEASLEAMLIEHQAITKCLKVVDESDSSLSDASLKVVDESDSSLSDASHALIHLIHFYDFQLDARSMQPVSQEWQPLALAPIDVMKLLHDLRLVEVALSGGLSETAPSTKCFGPLENQTMA